jgi:hypothetical protein
MLTLPSGRKHAIVDRSQCMGCHSADIGTTIGLEAAQLDRDDVDYGHGRLGNPLATLVKLGMTDGPIAREAYAPLPRAQSYQTAERRARGYLHANCAHCHRGGEDRMDLRFTTAFRDMHLCNVPGRSPAGGRARLAPGAPDESQLLRAMRTTGEGRMPPFESLIADDEALPLISSWITSLGGCD